MFRKILIPIAYLPTATETLRWGARLSQRFHSDLTLLYTLPPAQHGPLHARLTEDKMAEWGLEPPSFQLLREAEAFLKAEGVLKLNEAGQVVERHAFKGLEQGLYEVHLKGSHGENVRLRLREGAPALQILKEAEDLDYDLILIGTRGRQGFRRHLLGSVAQDVALHAPCSVLVAKRLHRVQQIMVGISGRPSALVALRQAVELALALELPLRLIAIYRDRAQRRQAQGHLDVALETATGLGLEAVPLLVEGAADEALLYHAGSGTLLALGSTPLSMVQRYVLGDLSLKILDRGRCSVLIAVPARRLEQETG